MRRNGTAGLARLGVRAFFAGLLSLACGQLLGEIEVQTVALEPSGPVASCEPGDVRCSAEGKLQACVRFEPGAPGGWLDQYACGSPDLCVAGPQAVCLPRVCQAGEVSCAGATPRVCNAGLTGWDELAACESAAHCSTESAECPEGAPCCLVEPCEPGALRCNDGNIEQCQADLSGWASTTSCASQELCLSSLAECGAGATSCACNEPACEDGQTRCTDSTLQICNAGRTDWDPVGECGSPELCQRGLALAPARCDAPACSPGQFLCDGASLQLCRDDLTGFDPAGECDGPAFCNAGGGRCEPAPCEAGERSCNGAQIQVCSDDRSGFVPEGVPCATPELCDDTDPTDVHCDPPACDVDDFDCAGTSQLSACNAGRTALEPVGAPCLRPDLCSVERRRCDFCFPGRQECTPDLGASRVCALSGNFFGPETPCPLGCVPATGQCQTCNIGDYVCAGGTLSRCNDGRSFTSLGRGSDCSNGLVVACTNGVVVRSQCAPGFSCVGTGQCICNPGPPFCNGDQLVTCEDGELEPADQCQGEDGDVLTTCEDGVLEEDRCDSPRDCRRSDGVRCDD